jgi:alkylation response protein AidB-like acyl-CoA dehydrogenase
MPGQPPIDRRMYATKRVAVGKMYARLANMRALWWQAFSEAKGFPTKGEVHAHVRRAVQCHGRVRPRSTSMAIRTCGGQSMLKSLPLERMYRDSRCGALMLPYHV